MCLQWAMPRSSALLSGELSWYPAAGERCLCTVLLLSQLGAVGWGRKAWLGSCVTPSATEWKGGDLGPVASQPWSLRSEKLNAVGQ